MKKCTICKEDKVESDFNKKSKSKDGYQSHCRQCSKQRYRKRYQSNSASDCLRVHERRRLIAGKFNNYKQTLSCKFCGENAVCCLDFHHVGDKTLEISNMVRDGYSWQRIMEEVARCLVMCANCHRKLHAGLLGCL